MKQLETNLDDMTPETLAYVQERLLAAGALDVWYIPIVMKKVVRQLPCVCFVMKSNRKRWLTSSCRKQSVGEYANLRVSERFYPRKKQRFPCTVNRCA